MNLSNEEEELKQVTKKIEELENDLVDILNTRHEELNQIYRDFGKNVKEDENEIEEGVEMVMKKV